MIFTLFFIFTSDSNSRFNVCHGCTIPSNVNTLDVLCVILQTFLSNSAQHIWHRWKVFNSTLFCCKNKTKQLKHVCGKQSFRVLHLFFFLSGCSECLELNIWTISERPWGCDFRCFSGNQLCIKWSGTCHRGNQENEEKLVHVVFVYSELHLPEIHLLFFVVTPLLT